MFEWMSVAVNYQKTQDGSDTAFSERVEGSGAFSLKLRRTGPEITGYYAKGGEGGWIEIGTHYFIEFTGHMSAAAWNEASNVPEGGFRLDYVEIRQLE